MQGTPAFFGVPLIQQDNEYHHPHNSQQQDVDSVVDSNVQELVQGVFNVIGKHRGRLIVVVPEIFGLAVHVIGFEPSVSPASGSLGYHCKCILKDECPAV